jgi:hypothetical protein
MDVGAEEALFAVGLEFWEGFRLGLSGGDGCSGSAYAGASSDGEGQSSEELATAQAILPWG